MTTTKAEAKLMSTSSPAAASAVTVVTTKPHVATPSSHKDSEVHRIALRFLCSSVASAAAESVTFPLDTLKVAQQSGGKIGLIPAARSIVDRAGITGFYRGLSPALARGFVYGGINVSFYPTVRRAIFGDIDPNKMSYAGKILSGGTAGALGQFVACPMDVVKIRIQAQSAGTYSYGYRGPLHAVSTIWRTEGIRGLWRGWSPAVQRAAIVNGAWMASYDQSKHWVLSNTNFGDGALTYAIASQIAGFACCIASCPADVVKTRLINSMVVQTATSGSTAAAAATPKYSGTFDCLRQTVASEGFGALYRGFVPSLVRLGPWGLVFFLAFEPLSARVLGKSQI